jgi:hypothetical protein
VAIGEMDGEKYFLFEEKRLKKQVEVIRHYVEELPYS